MLQQQQQLQQQDQQVYYNDNNIILNPSTARHMTDLIHADVRSMVAHSRLTRQSKGIALVERPHLTVGKLLGTGAFSAVHQVQLRGSGSTVYAMKHLQSKLVQQAENFRLAAAELAVEAHMLASFDHPNIIKVRGWAANGVASFSQGRHDSFFLLLDCLEETLDQRITKWHEQQLQWQAEEQSQSQTSLIADIWKRLSYNPQQEQLSLPPMGQQQETSLRSALRRQHQAQVYLEKLGVCTEISSALTYLHSKGVIFRDLKPNNIGFLNGQVKLFDFGLSRELPGCSLTEPFQMSGKVGTLRYMAVEVACHQPYNVSSDVYSWAMVCYETLSLQKPFAGWTRDMHRDLVCARGMRPTLQWDATTASCYYELNPVVQTLLQAGWDQVPTLRPTMLQVMHQMQQLEQHQIMVLNELQQQVMQLQQQQEPIVELPHDFSIVRKAPGRNLSDYTGATLLSYESLAGYQ